MQNVLITGVSSGIGLELARSYLEKGDHVYGISRREPPEPVRSNPRFAFHSLDLRCHEKIAPALSALLEGLDNLELVILNAAIIGKIADLKETTRSELEATMQVNVWANKTILDVLFSKPITVRRVVAISSGASLAAQRGWNGYAISKAALNMMIGLYAAEKPDTHFCSFGPGIVDTPMQSFLRSLPSDERFPSLEQLRHARGTPVMPDATEAAPRLASAFEKAQHLPSGAYVNLHEIDGFLERFKSHMRSLALKSALFS